jgi:photosystem II stability/assembly factor-like uncharacterized protein
LKESSVLKVARILSVGLVFFLFLGAKKEKPKEEIFFDENIFDALEWRCIGPANMGGRIDDLAVVEKRANIIYVATASGGLWKTVNSGVTWESIFDNQTTSSIGDVTVNRYDPDIVWVGTGEQNNRQSSSWGDGVYKSTDGGRTWDCMGLRDSHHIGRIVIHPKNADIVFVAALGHLWGPNKERGLFKTANGGKTWTISKFIDEDTGFVDVAIDPESPDTLYAASYQRRRTAFGFNGGGPGSGLWKTTDGGENWISITAGLPAGVIGRIGIDIYQRNPAIVYAIIEHSEGGVFRSEDKGLTWKKMSSVNPRPMYYSQIRIDPENDQRIYVLGDSMYISEDGGKTFSTNLVKRYPREERRVHSDHHAMWINPENSNHLIIGTDGGIYISYDRGKSWDFIDVLPIGQFYEIDLDGRQPYYVYGGLQDNGCWGGPSATWKRLGISDDEWIKFGGGDGFYVQVDPSDDFTIYGESQEGHLFRFNLKTGESKPLRPQSENEDEVYRFNWNTPILISPHDSNTIYLGGNKLFLSYDRGDNWDVTGDLTTQQDRDRLTIMGVVPDQHTLSRHDGVAFYGTITTISESPIKKGVLYVGTDDGYVQVSKNGGTTWENVADKLSGVPRNTYVSRIIASNTEEGTAYVTFDGHRSGDFKPYVYMTKNYGKTWKNISSNLLEGGTVSVIREHPRRSNLLFVGTERGAFFSIDQGGKWIKFKSNLPIVPIDDIAIHPRENDLVLGTHGRSIWILDDIQCLEQLNEEILGLNSYLFDLRPAIIFSTSFSNVDYFKGQFGHRIFLGPNPPPGAIITYYLKEDSRDEVRIIICDDTGQKIRKLEGPKKKGINRMTWDLKHGLDVPSKEKQIGDLIGPYVLPGKYHVTLEMMNKKITKIIFIEDDPELEISFEDRKAQHDALLYLAKLLPSLSSANQVIENFQNQIEELQKNLRKLSAVPVNINDRVQAIIEELDGMRMKLIGVSKLGKQETRSSIRGNLLGIYNSLERYSAPPSERQILKITQYSDELKKTIENINKMIETNIPSLNKILNEHNIPFIFPGDKIKVE